MTKRFLQILFSIFFLVILWATIRASLDRGILQAGSDLWPDKWFQATLVDTYLAFLTFYVWVFYKEAKWFARILWFVLIMALGNLAIAAYVLIQLWKSKDGSPEKILLRQ
jgi:hypothetical protein